MTDILTSGSAVERALICDASVALPHAHYETPYTHRGSTIHDFLEAVSKVGRDEALVQLDEEARGVCEALDLEGLHDQLSLTAEVSFAYDFEKDTARELGRGQGRKYDDVGRTEIPCTLDVVGLRPVPAGLRGVYVEWKSGWSTRRPISLVTQVAFGSLVLARAYGCDVVEGQLVNVHEDVKPYLQRQVFEAWELDCFAAELRERAVKWRELRDRFDAGVMPRDFNAGPWCDRCSSREFCPATALQVRAALNARDNFDGPLRVQLDTLDDAALFRLWDQVRDAKSVLSMLEGRIRGIASSRSLKLKQPDGSHRVLGEQLVEGNDKVDGEVAFDVLSELCDEETASTATKVTATKKDIDAAVKDWCTRIGAKRGVKAEKLRAIYAKLKAANGITAKISPKVVEYTLPPALEEQLQKTLDDVTGKLTPDDIEALEVLDVKLPRTEDNT